MHYYWNTELYRLLAGWGNTKVSCPGGREGPGDVIVGNTCLRITIFIIVVFLISCCTIVVLVSIINLLGNVFLSFSLFWHIGSLLVRYYCVLLFPKGTVHSYCFKKNHSRLKPLWYSHNVRWQCVFKLTIMSKFKLYQNVSFENFN